MIASWMLTAVLVGILAAAGAAAAGRILTALRRPSRFAWIAAMVMTSLWPVLAYWRAHRGNSSPGAAAPVGDGVQRLATVMVTASERALHVPFDTALLIAWAVASAVLLLRMIMALRALSTHGRGWRAESVDGVRVRLSSDTGPAVVGIAAMEVVLPQWALELDQPLRALVLRHEEEHRRARDPYLLLASAIMNVLTPWNLALWWQARRLRLAIEVDCDARVLRADPRPERYGMLLLAIAQRRTANRTLLAPALSEPVSNLEHRIKAMKTSLASPSRSRLALLGGIAITTIVVACSIDAPTTPAPRTESALRAPNFRVMVDTAVTSAIDKHLSVEPGVYRIARKVLGHTSADTAYAFTRQTPNGPITYTLHRDPVRFTKERREPPIVEQGYVSRDSVKREIPTEVELNEVATYKESQVTKPARQSVDSPRPIYPARLKNAGVEGEVTARFIVDPAGHVLTGSLYIAHSTGPEFSDAVRDWVRTARFTPAEIDGKPVTQVVELPITFTIH